MANQQRPRSPGNQGAEVKPAVKAVVTARARALAAEGRAPRKIHVIFQKPLAASYKDALAIQALARKHGIQVVTDFDIAFYATTHAAKARADSGEIGGEDRRAGAAARNGRPHGVSRASPQAQQAGWRHAGARHERRGHGGGETVDQDRQGGRLAAFAQVAAGGHEEV